MIEPIYDYCTGAWGNVSKHMPLGTYWPLISPLVFSLSPCFQAESGRVKYTDIFNNGT